MLGYLMLCSASERESVHEVGNDRLLGLPTKKTPHAALKSLLSPNSGLGGYRS